MKKAALTVFLSLLVGILPATDVPASMVKEEFSGSMSWTAELPGTVRIAECRRVLRQQIVYWELLGCHYLLDGHWISLGENGKRVITQYSTPGGKVPCILSQEPPDNGTINTLEDLGVGITQGRFELYPERVPGGYWEGEWKITFHPDGSRFFTARGSGVGRDLEGQTLRVYTRLYPPFSTPMPINGWVITPARAD